MNRFSYKLGHNFQLDKQRKQKIMFIMARMVSCTVFDEMNQLFISLCMTSLSKNLYPEIQKYFDKLDNAISISSEEFNVDLEYLPELDEEFPNSLGDGNTYRTRSPFGIHFQSELQNCMQAISQLESKKRVHNLETNLYFLPDFPKSLVTYYMPICPLWSGLILGPQLYPSYPSMTYTNAIAENWMRIVKITILKMNPNSELGIS